RHLADQVRDEDEAAGEDGHDRDLPAPVRPGGAIPSELLEIARDLSRQLRDALRNGLPVDQHAFDVALHGGSLTQRCRSGHDAVEPGHERLPTYLVRSGRFGLDLQPYGLRVLILLQ